jgi:hypothetical protein
MEVRLIEALRDSADPAGTIGLQAGRSLQRMPSSIYWQGLASWGIRHFGGSQAAYHRWIGSGARARLTVDDDGEPIDGHGVIAWDPGLPEAPEDFPSTAAFGLAVEEARYLRRRVMETHPDSLLAVLFSMAEPHTNAPFPWLHEMYGDLPAHLVQQLDLARRFATSIHGAALTYNALLARKRGDDDLLEEYLGELDSWAAETAATDAGLPPALRHELWAIAYASSHRITPATRRFIDTWLDIALEPPGRSAVDDGGVVALISQRELRLKGRSARLHNEAALLNWNGASGRHRLSFRWGVARRFVSDVRSALVAEGAHA